MATIVSSREMGQKRRDEGKTTSSHMHTATGKTTNGSSSNKKNNEENESGSSTLNNMKDGSKSKMESGSKDLCGGSTGKRHNEGTNNKDVTFILQQVKEVKKLFASSKGTDGMLHYCVKRGGMTKKKYGRHIPNIFMGTGKYDYKHGVGIILNKKWRQRIFDTEHINERVITAIVANRQRIKLMSVYFTQLRICGPSHRKNVQKDFRSTQKTAKDTHSLPEETSMQNWNVVTEPNAQVLEDTLHEGNKKRLLVEKLADATGLHRFQHDVQKRASETNDHHISER